MRYDNRLNIVICIVMALAMYAIDEMVGVIIFVLLTIIMAVMHGKRKVKFRN